MPALKEVRDTLDGDEYEIRRSFNVTEFEDIKNGINKLKIETRKATDGLEEYKSRFGYIFEQSFLKIVVYDAYSGDIIEDYFENFR